MAAVKHNLPEVGAPSMRIVDHAPEEAKAKPERQGRWWGMLCGFVSWDIARLSPLATVVWLVLFRNSTGRTVRMSQEQIASIAGVDVRTARRAVAELVKSGIVTVKIKGRMQTGPSTYFLRPSPETDSNRTDLSH